MEIRPYLRKAQYHETDQMGIIHHSNYIRWFEEARVDFMDQAGFGYENMEAEGVSSPVLAVSCEYRSMVRFGDTVEIRAQIQQFTGARMILSYQVLDAVTREIRAAGQSRHCFLGRAGRPVSLKKASPRAYELFLSHTKAAGEE